MSQLHPSSGTQGHPTQPASHIPACSLCSPWALLGTWCPPSPAVSLCDKLLPSHLSSVECLVFSHLHYLMGGDPFCYHWGRRRQLINMGILAYAEPSSRELPPRLPFRPSQNWVLPTMNVWAPDAGAASTGQLLTTRSRGMSGTGLARRVFMLRAWHLKNAGRKRAVFCGGRPKRNC